MSMLFRSALTAAAMTVFTLPAFAAGDAVKGEKVFKKCLACHVVTADGPKKAGPSLFNVVGRTTGTVEGFGYSNKMREMGEEGHVWTPEELEIFLENPKGLVPGTKMTFAGLKKPDERADVVAYLLTMSPDAAAGAAAPAEAAPAEAEPAPAEPAAAE